MTPRNAEAPLIDALHAGSPDALERLYADYHAPIFNLCARILGDREEAKDLTQEVFIKAFTDLPEPGRKLKLRPWLYRVATNACFNQLRARKRGDHGDAAIEDMPSPVDAFEQARTVALVEASLGELNERYRTALVLKDLQGLPAEEIAEVMEVSRPTADVLVHRARASFKTAFARLAGADATAPAALGLVLLPLTVPAALQAMPPLPAGLAPTHALPTPDISSAVGPAGVGLLAKIGAAVSTKAAVTAAAAAVVIGGGAVAVKEGGRSDRQGPAAATAATSAPAGTGSRPSSPYTAMHDRHRAGHGALWGEHDGAARHAGSVGHDSDGTHDGATHDSTATSTHDAGDAGRGSTTTHDAGGDASTTTHDSGTSTSPTSSNSTGTTTTHDGGDTSGSHDGGTGD